ncbi:hypothetical protein ACKWTF_008015 [Chironomus riparius]
MIILNLIKRTTFAAQLLNRSIFNNSLYNGIKYCVTRNIHLSQPAHDINEDVNNKLMEFFDVPKNWNENEVKHGRSWNLAELRIKSNSDLHKIWFILLKELNMLKTMEHEYKREWKWWASPERIDKVQDSMKNIETVVRERNQAYHMLENGTDGEQPGQYITNALGLREYKKSVEHIVPYWANKKWREANPRGCHGPDYQKFMRLYREKIYNDKRKGRNRDKNHVIRLLSRFPNLDRNVLKGKYPQINFDTLNKKDLYRGHYVPDVE